MTTFAAQAGFNGISIETTSGGLPTRFSRQKGFNAVSIAIPEPLIFRFFQDGTLYAGELTMTVTEGAVSYSTTFTGGVADFYEITGAQVTVSISDGTSSGSINITPTVNTDFNLAFIYYKIKARVGGRRSNFSNNASVVCLTEI